jgi:protein gp37
LGDKTTIAWTDATWNPIRGCTRVSPGCVNCYAEVVAARFSGPGQPYEGLATRVNGHTRWTNRVRFIPEHLADPLRWQRPRRIFVNSMSDLFHEHLTAETVAQVWAVMALAPQHIYQILTKRPQRMYKTLTMRGFYQQVLQHADRLRGEFPRKQLLRVPVSDPTKFPYRHVWLGTSVEDQQRADERIPWLVKTPAAVRFLSCEPLLGPINLHRYLWQGYHYDTAYGREWDVTSRDDLHWVIVGGESGRGYREMDLAWAQSLQEQCSEMGVPFFFKQDSALRSGQGEAALGRIYHEFPELQV